ncbi:polygalacturonase inhibitor-like [Olea europaea var. sylvestris]|uniref:Polygalacturonase inhibitor-like n=1 Tax=Olea europaea subsp. europaea TaxID=158383 RepID=A0A8S0PZV7_OLEEU|nr:polygalacturonase inhibitor-like [Olea europaea var. sylvestris]CAA2957753.1 polygalacturonase inhibitor-like [Olea europaea subsp. europaea]
MKNSNFVTLSVFCLIFLSRPFFSLSATERCNPNDKKVLLQIKQALNNPYQLASWNPNTDCCDWYVVDCDPNNNRIVTFNLFSANISGQIPTAIGDLPYLETLVFRQLTNVTGRIPAAIAKLTNLKLLRLSYTNLTGPVPIFLTQLKNLTFLDLSFNDLTGSVPAELSLLRNLNALHLDRNRLTGTIPESFGKFTGKVPDLYLSHNNLTGSVPLSLGDLNFTVLDFSRNNLIGDVSFLFGRNNTIQIVNFSRNMFEFNLSNVQFPDSLTSLDLNHNMISGSLPQDLTKLNLQFLNVSYNRLCGQIPTGGKLQSFDISSYLHNKCLCGAPLPACN